MSTLVWVATGVLAYWIVVSALDRRGYFPEYVGTQGPITTLHTKRGREFLDRLARRKRFWRAWANVGVGVALVVMFLSFVFMLVAAVGAVRNPQPTEFNQPRNALAIPGVNDFLPMSMAPEIVFGLLVGLVVHEGGHGLLCRVEDIEIESMGLALFTILPIGAFVEPDEENQRAANRGSRTRMFAAGVTNNFVVTILALALLFGPVAGSIAVAPGAAVGGSLPGSGAEEADIGEGDRITGIEGQSIAGNGELQDALESTDEREVTVELNGEDERTVTRRLLVSVATADAPASLSVGDRITAVEGAEVHTEPRLREALRDGEVATVTVESDGEERREEFPAGALVQVREDSPLADAGVSTGSAVVVAVDGERTVATDDLSELLDGHETGDVVEVAVYQDGQRETHSVTLGSSNDGSATLGPASPGITGITISDFGIQLYPASGYLAALGGDAGEHGLNPALTDSFVGKTLLVLFLPFAGMSLSPALPYHFPGFTAEVANFYVVDGPLAALGGGAFVLANLLFWISWINVNLAFFNCIPAFPLDGGHILRTSAESVISRLPVDATYELTKTVTTTVGVTMLVSLLVVLFGPVLLG